MRKKLCLRSSKTAWKKLSLRLINLQLHLRTCVVCLCRPLFLKHLYIFLGLWSNMNRSSWLSGRLYSYISSKRACRVSQGWNWCLWGSREWAKEDWERPSVCRSGTPSFFYVKILNFLLVLHAECKRDSVPGENPLREHNEKQGPTWY